MNLSIHLISQSQPIYYNNVINTYVKNGMYCIFVILNAEKKVYKYPLINIFRVIEDYN